jgi:hypothetical protein
MQGDAHGALDGSSIWQLDRYSWSFNDRFYYRHDYFSAAHGDKKVERTRMIS